MSSMEGKMRHHFYKTLRTGVYAGASPYESPRPLRDSMSSWVQAKAKHQRGGAVNLLMKKWS